jgi:hypothetical protein
MVTNCNAAGVAASPGGHVKTCVLVATITILSTTVPTLANSSELDGVSPVLTSFDSKPTFDVTRSENPWGVAFKATDDESGVMAASAIAVGPSGQRIFVSFQPAFPSTKLSGHLNIRSTSIHAYAFLEPGPYSFQSASLTDVRGNGAQYNEAQLAALGKTTFLVKNTKGFDITAPTLQSGKILTPTMSVTAKQPGALVSAWLGIAVDIADSGNSAVSGVWDAMVRFSLPSKPDVGFYLFGGDETASGQLHLPRATVRAGAQIPDNFPPGEYHLESIRIRDFAANTRLLRSTEFGGETDFSSYFPTTSITLTP